MSMFEFIFGLVFIFTFFYPLCALILFFMFASFRTEVLRRDYRKTLCEHDRRVLDDYFFVTWFNYRKFKKNPHIDINFDRKADE